MKPFMNMKTSMRKIGNNARRAEIQHLESKNLKNEKACNVHVSFDIYICASLGCRFFFERMTLVR